MRKGVILCGGEGTRLRPLTLIQNKHLLPIYNKPMVLYPLETLKALKIKDILIISGGEHIGRFTEFLGDGSRYGVNVTYRVQESAGGIAGALGLAEDFAGEDEIVVILGDNIFDNSFISGLSTEKNKEGAVFFFSKQENPSRFGVPVLKGGELIAIEEKPQEPKSSYAVVGLYIYPPNVFDIIKRLKPSARGELEITDVNNWYIKEKKCDYIILDCYWSDAGTFDSLLNSANWVKEQNK
jgi:glucose-1-phosphate thymidylyltransferase